MTYNPKSTMTAQNADARRNENLARAKKLAEDRGHYPKAKKSDDAGTLSLAVENSEA